MRLNFQKIALMIISAAVILVACPTWNEASDLATGANIFMFPKPLRVSNMVLRNPLGKTVSLSDFRGKVVLLHFWSIQCPACRMEEPLLDKLRRTFGPAGLEIVGVNLIDQPQAIFNHCASNKVPFPVLFDGGAGFSLKPVKMGGKATAFVVNPRHEAILEVPGFPTTYILDCRGDAVGYSIGAAHWDHRSAVSLIQSLIANRKTCLAETSRTFGNLF
jgi:thiol-disulfide isomerase/thioredoxin